MTFVVVLTGGIGSGKTTVSNYFNELGVPIIDTDIIAKDLVRQNSPCYQPIVDKFGKEILADDLSINRKKLRTLIFADAAAKQWLEQLLHPKIIEMTKQKIITCQAPYCIVVVPLFAELQDKFSPFTNAVLVIDTTEALQRKRLMQRDQISEILVEQMLAAQATRQQRLKLADDVLTNSGDLLTVKDNVFMLHKKYLQQAPKK